MEVGAGSSSQVSLEASTTAEPRRAQCPWTVVHETLPRRLRSEQGLLSHDPCPRTTSWKVRWRYVRAWLSSGTPGSRRPGTSTHRPRPTRSPPPVAPRCSSSTPRHPRQAAGARAGPGLLARGQPEVHDDPEPRPTGPGDVRRPAAHRAGDRRHLRRLPTHHLPTPGRHRHSPASTALKCEKPIVQCPSAGLGKGGSWGGP